MQALVLPATPCSPEVEFNFDQGLLRLKGESYPENAAAFYRPLLESVHHWLSASTPPHITMEIALAYFNSSSTKMLFALLEALSQAAQAGSNVTLRWYHDREDDTQYDFGKELELEFPALHFEILALN